MNAYLNIVCKKEHCTEIKKQLLLFAHNCNANLINVDERTYWKEDKCSYISTKMFFQQYSYEKVRSAIIQLWAKEQEVVYSEDDTFIEFAVYLSIPEILQYNRIFLTMGVQKKERQGTVSVKPE